ncbi:alpha/beta-hydrolase [Hyaloscypha variabilis]
MVMYAKRGRECLCTGKRGRELPVTFQSRGITTAANIFHPPEESKHGKKPAIVVTGFTTLAFDAAYQGESGGEPRYLEDSYQRVEDIKSAVTFLTTRDDVDPKRIGALGICATVATISAIDIGKMFREGRKERTAEAKGDKPHLEHIVPHTPQDVTEDTSPLFKRGTDYYRTPRAAHSNSVNLYIARSIDILATYSSYAFVEMISPHPLLMIAGSEAESLKYSQDAIAAAKEPKELFLVPGKTHIDLYDNTEGVTPKLVEFMKEYLEN